MRPARRRPAFVGRAEELRGGLRLAPGLAGSRVEEREAGRLPAAAEQAGGAAVERHLALGVVLALDDDRLALAARPHAAPEQLAAQVDPAGAEVEPFPLQTEQLVAAEAGGQGE